MSSGGTTAGTWTRWQLWQTYAIGGYARTVVPGSTYAFDGGENPRSASCSCNGSPQKRQVGPPVSSMSSILRSGPMRPGSARRPHKDICDRLDDPSDIRIG